MSEREPDAVYFLSKRDRLARRRAERKAGLQRRHPARVARLLAMAHDTEARIAVGEFEDYADVARAHGFTRARLTQIMNLLLLAPGIQEEVLHLEVLPGREAVTERNLRRVLRSLVWEEQWVEWARIRRRCLAGGTQR